MATFDSAWCLDQFNQRAGRPATDTQMTDAQKYMMLTTSQNRIIGLLSGITPNSLYPQVAYGSIPTLTTTDNQVFTFGTDANGYAKFPMGKGGIYASLNDIPNTPWREGIDYINQGQSIRIPNNGSYGGTLYWYGVAQPADIDATHQPALMPEASRELIVIDAVRQFAKQEARNPVLIQVSQDEWNQAWPTWCLVWRTQYRNGGALGNVTGMQLAYGSWQNQWAT